MRERPEVTGTPEFKEGDEESLDFVSFFRDERSSLYGAMVMVTRSPSEAEEIVQEAFVRVWERWEVAGSHPDPRAYLYRTAFNLIRQRRRSIRRAAGRFTTVPSVRDPFERADDLADISAALGRLTRRQRTAVVLIDLLGFDSKAAARLMGSRPGTVRSLASQGRSVLREAIGDRDA